MSSHALMQPIVAHMINATGRDHIRRRSAVWKIPRSDVTIRYVNRPPGAQMTAPMG